MRFPILTLLLSLPITLSSSPSSSEPSNPNWWQSIPIPLQKFIAQYNSPHANQDLEKRQHGVAGAAGDAPATVITQMSPTTTYNLEGQQVVFTQKFQPTPDPWSGPVNGEIGLGTIKGQIGKVKSKS